MERRRIDTDPERTRDYLLKEEKKVYSRIKDLTNENVEIWAAAPSAFDNVGLPYPKTEGAPSFTKAFLAEHTHELPKLILDAVSSTRRTVRLSVPS